MRDAERLWREHANDILAHDEAYQAALREQQRVGRHVGIAYIVLVLSLLAFMSGFYLWRLRFFWAIVFYVVMWVIAALAARVIVRHSMKNDHLGELIHEAHKRFINESTSERCHTVSPT
jgi:hypothetical protein